MFFLISLEDGTMIPDILINILILKITFLIANNLTIILKLQRGGFILLFVSLYIIFLIYIWLSALSLC